jgi:hypothetical protein
MAELSDVSEAPRQIYDNLTTKQSPENVAPPLYYGVTCTHARFIVVPGKCFRQQEGVKFHAIVAVLEILRTVY